MVDPHGNRFPQTPHSPTPGRVLSVSGAAGAKANSSQSDVSRLQVELPHPPPAGTCRLYQLRLTKVWSSAARRIHARWRADVSARASLSALVSSLREASGTLLMVRRASAVTS